MLDLFGYGAFFLTMALSYAIICLGLNVQWGQTGLFNVGVAGFVAVGAYASALLTTPDAPGRARRLRPADRRRLGRRRARRRPRSPSSSARITIRLRADYLAIATFGVAVAVQLAPAQPRAADRRPLRHRLHPAPLRRHRRHPERSSPRSTSASSSSSSPLLYLALERLLRSPWGRVLRAIREDETAARALGKRADRFRLQAFAIGGAIMGLAGAVQAHFIGFIAPENYLPMLTFQVWAMLIVGGSGNNRGAILGAVVVWGLWAVSSTRRRLLLPRRPAGPRRRAADRAHRRRALRHPAPAPARHPRRGARRSPATSRAPRTPPPDDEVHPCRTALTAPP